MVIVMLLAVPIFSAKGQVTFLDRAYELNLHHFDVSISAAIVDLDNDFVNEIIVINHGLRRLYVWQGSAYQDMGDYYEMNLYCYYANNITVADVNFDYKPDLYINDAGGFCAKLYINDMPLPFQEMTAEYGLGETADVGSVFFQMTPTSGLCLLAGPRLLNLQNGVFVDITPGSGLENLTNVFCPVFFDIDGDYDDDLFIAGNHEFNYGVLFRNNGDGTFTDISTNTDENGFGYGQEVSFGDIDNDGDFDLYLTAGRDGQGSPDRPNTMWANDGTGYFTNITELSNTGYRGYSRSSSFGDFDNDGDIDLFVNRTEGYKVLFLNDGGGVFTDYSEEAGVNDRSIGMGCAVGDLNNDGQLDIIAANADWYNQHWIRNNVYINQNADSSYLKVKAVGCEPNTLALGAIVELSQGRKLIGKREISSHPIFGGVNDLVAHFGTGIFTNLALTVHFQSGVIQDTMGLEPGQTVIIYECELTHVDDPEDPLPRQSVIVSAYPNPFNSSTRITINGGEDIYDLGIFDILGRKVRFAIENRMDGSTSFTWDGQNDLNQPLPSGVYFIRVQNDRAYSEIKVTLIE